ncbi:type IVB secretion system protein DotA [Rickettsiella massiliensis]|uniref:type IVB secretion system protein DotA n=1 Tax=Rickettsiella massiliensis TaxID=676517 RepID=UPI00029A1A02|nr:type IVB secretion system protein DotA [Rickettsiella massiliensis]
MKKILSFVLFFTFPSLLLAQGSPTPTDLSKDYLSTIFGVVDGVLHGTGSEILGTMFGTFNSIVLVLASMMLSYVLFISILNTSHEGEFLGKKWSSVWVPIRTVAGVSLLLPKATGYSFVQILVMAVVVQGVNAADKVWNVALDYMNQNGTIIEPIQSIHSDDKKQDHSFLVGKAGSILKSEVCMLALQNALITQNNTNATGVVVPNFMSLLTITGKGPNGENTGRPIDYTKDTGGYITFPSGNLQGVFAPLKGVCGSVSWDFISKKSLNSTTSIAANDSTSTGVWQFALGVESLAHSIADRLVPPNQSSIPPVKLQVSDLLNDNTLIDSAEDFFTIVKPALRSLKDDSASKYKDFIKEAKGYGWILAGSYYYRMASLNQQLRQADISALDQKITPSFSPDYANGPFNSMVNLPNVLQNLKNNLPNSGGVIDQYITEQTNNAKYMNNPQDSNVNMNSPYSTKGGASYSDRTGIIASAFNLVVPVWGKMFTMQQQVFDEINHSKLDPVFALTKVGNDMISSAEDTWSRLIGIFMTASAVAIVGGAASGFWTPALGVNIMLLIVELVVLIGLPIAVWLGSTFVLGSVLSYYIPMIPFLLFVFGAITWFAVVLEAILAAPLVALGITHPEGHDLMGKAEQSIMLLSSVFLRPLLMIFGFIFGIILSYVGLSLFNKGYSIANQFLNEFNGDVLGFIYQLAMMGIYTAAALAIINRSFAMIHEVPNKVLRWIGGPQDSGHEEAIMQSIRSQHDSDAGASSNKLQQQLPDVQKLGSQFRAGREMTSAASSTKKEAKGAPDSASEGGDQR